MFQTNRQLKRVLFKPEYGTKTNRALWDLLALELCNTCQPPLGVVSNWPWRQSLTPVQESLWTNSRARRHWLCLWKWCIVGVGVRLAQQQAKERNAGGHPNADYILSFFQTSWIRRFHIICLRYYSFARYFLILAFIISFPKWNIR